MCNKKDVEWVYDKSVNSNTFDSIIESIICPILFILLLYTKTTKSPNVFWKNIKQTKKEEVFSSFFLNYIAVTIFTPGLIVVAIAIFLKYCPFAAAGFAFTRASITVL